MEFFEWLKRLVKESGLGNKPTLDLHGLSVKAALDETQKFVERSYRMGVPSVRIIYGKGLGSPGGRGILREIIPKWCKQEGQEYIASFQREIDPTGGDGSLIVILKKPPAL